MSYVECLKTVDLERVDPALFIIHLCVSVVYIFIISGFPGTYP